MRALSSRLGFLFLLILCSSSATYVLAERLFIPMDEGMQHDHLKAYGVVYTALQDGMDVRWLLNYRGGSFIIEDNDSMQQLCNERGVTCSPLSNGEYNAIQKEMGKGGNTFNTVKLERPPKIAVYTPTNKKPWDDAVTLALTYAQIPFDKIYADEVLDGALDKYNWLHLHHEDFTGQLGKYWGQYHDAPWYIAEQAAQQAIAERHGFHKISKMQLAVVKKIRDFVGAGGNLFAMCSATETFDIALAAQNTDICDSVFDGDPVDPDFQSKLDYSQCLAFQDFRVFPNPVMYEHSTIDNFTARMVPENADTFVLEVFPAKPDPVPAMLTQDHITHIKGFMGQTTVFRRPVIKPGVILLAGYPQPPGVKGVDNVDHTTWSIYNMHDHEARYIHGDYGKGTWTFYSGHDPEDFQHLVGDPPTDLSHYPNSPGYRLILNNVLLPAVNRPDLPKLTVAAPVVPEKKKPVEISAPDTYNIYPAGDQLTVSVNHNADAAGRSNNKIERVIITDAQGKEYINRPVNAETGTIDIKELPKGMYLININGAYAGKLMKE